MSDALHPQIYLVTPDRFELSRFADRLGAVLDAAPVACLRLALASRDVGEIGRVADALRPVAHARDVALVIADHLQLVQPLGLDGVHLPDGAARVRAARTLLGGDAIVGAACGVSRHAGLTAGEAGADYIAFGPVSAAPELGDGAEAPAALFAWWSEMIELPVIAEGGLTLARIGALAGVVDFFALGPEIWDSADAADTLSAFHSAMSEAPTERGAETT